MTYKVLDNALPEHLCVMTHRFAESSDQWQNMGSDLIKEEVLKDHSTFPIMPVVKDNQFLQIHPLAGFYMCISQLVAEQSAKLWGYKSYNTDLQRIHFVAHRSGERGTVVPHRDHYGDYYSAILQLSTTDWKPEWGGSTFVGDDEIPFVKNRLITFQSDVEHYGTPPNPSCPQTRIVLNVIFRID